MTETMKKIVELLEKQNRKIIVIDLSTIDKIELLNVLIPFGWKLQGNFMNYCILEAPEEPQSKEKELLFYE